MCCSVIFHIEFRRLYHKILPKAWDSTKLTRITKKKTPDCKCNLLVRQYANKTGKTTIIIQLSGRTHESPKACEVSDFLLESPPFAPPARPRRRWSNTYPIQMNTRQVSCYMKLPPETTFSFQCGTSSFTIIPSFKGSTLSDHISFIP